MSLVEQLTYVLSMDLAYSPDLYEMRWDSITSCWMETDGKECSAPPAPSSATGLCEEHLGWFHA